VSPRSMPRRTHLSWPTPREGENPARVVRRIRLVRKPTTITNRSSLAPTSFLEESTPLFVLFYRASSGPCLSRQAGRLVRLRYADLTRSAMLRLLTSSENTTAGRFGSKLFGLHELPIGVYARGLTRGGPERYITIGGLTKSPNGPVAGLSPEFVESTV